MPELTGNITGNGHELVDIRLEKVFSLPSWTSADEGRIIFVTTAGASYGFWLGGSSSWVRAAASGGVVDNVADYAALRAVGSGSRSNWMRVLVQSEVAVYTFDPANTTPETLPEIVIPNDITHPAPGRWVRVAFDDTDEINVINNAAFAPLGLGSSFTLQAMLQAVADTYRARKYALSPATASGVTGTSTTGFDTAIKLISGHANGAGAQNAAGVILNSTEAHTLPLRDGSTGAPIVDDVTGNTVYGRLTWSGSNYVVSFYKLDASASEVTHNITSSTDVQLGYVWLAEYNLDFDDWFRDGVFSHMEYFSHIEGHASDIRIDSDTYRMLPSSTVNDVMASLLALDQEAVSCSTSPTVDNTIPRFDGDGTSPPVGPVIQGSGVLIDDDNNIDQSAATGYIRIAQGTTAERVGAAANGMLRYNETTDRYEAYADDPNTSPITQRWFDVGAGWEPEQSVVIHVSAGGDDSTGTGSPWQPFLTLDAALTAAAAIATTSFRAIHVHGWVETTSSGASLTISATEDLAIVGDGPEASGIYGAASADLITWVGDLTRCSIQNLSIHNTQGNVAAGVLVFGATAGSGLTECALKNVHIRGYGGGASTNAVAGTPKNSTDALLRFPIDTDTPWPRTVIDGIVVGWLQYTSGAHNWIDSSDRSYNAILIHGLSTTTVTDPIIYRFGRLTVDTLGHNQEVDYSNLHEDADYVGLCVHGQTNSMITVESYILHSYFAQSGEVIGLDVYSGGHVLNSSIQINTAQYNVSPTYNGPALLVGSRFWEPIHRGQTHVTHLRVSIGTAVNDIIGISIENGVTYLHADLRATVYLAVYDEAIAGSSAIMAAVYVAAGADVQKTGIIDGSLELYDAALGSAVLDMSATPYVGGVVYSGQGTMHIRGNCVNWNFGTGNLSGVCGAMFLCDSTDAQSVGLIEAGMTGGGDSSGNSIMMVYHNTAVDKHYLVTAGARLKGDLAETVDYAISRKGIGGDLDIVRPYDALNSVGSFYVAPASLGVINSTGAAPVALVSIGPGSGAHAIL